MKAIFFGVAMAGAFATAAMAQTAGQFDLSCAGNLSVKPLGNPDPVATPVAAGPFPYTTKLHVDLTRKTFCQDDCKSPQAIYAVQSDDIIFDIATGVQQQRFWMARDEGLFFKVWVEAGDVKKKQPDLLKSAQGQCTLLNPMTVVSDPASKSNAAVANTASAARPAEPASHSDPLTMDEVAALLDVSNHRQISPGLRSHLIAIGYIYWTDDTLKLTRKGRDTVGSDDQ